MTQHSALVGEARKGTPQSEPIPGSSQVPNSAGGYAWAVDHWQRLRRFLVLGIVGGTYYISQRKLVTENLTALDECLKEDGLQTVKLITEISQEGRAPSNDPALYALAYAAKRGDAVTRKAALDALPAVARIGTHLFHFASYVRQLGGFGRGTKRAIADWYRRDVSQVAFQAVKYRQRDGWSHRDLLRLTHIVPESPAQNALFNWITHRDKVLEATNGNLAVDPDESLKIVVGYEKAQAAATPRESAQAIREYGLPREAVQTDHLTSHEVWDALLEKTPTMALVRNLATMTANGFLTATSDSTQVVLRKLADEEAIRKSRIHPIAVLAALTTYGQGYGFRGAQTWAPVPKILDALDSAFYVAFKNVEPTNKRLRIALDVSGSMGWGEVNGIPGLTPRVAAAAMSMVAIRTESRYDVQAFSHNLREVSLSGRERLDDVLRKIDAIPMGGTDCALPMNNATKNGGEFDAFVVYTDNETWAGRSNHPAEALKEYRRASGITDAKLIVVAMTSNGFSIADPLDPGMLDVVGFDVATPNLMSEFIMGRV
jgi:60 kDa SS-A/Ro ribonucleoprotein